MSDTNAQQEADFAQALGESFAQAVSPPIPFEDASAQECCAVVWSILGRNVTPRSLAAARPDQLAALSAAFGAFFETEAPTVEQIAAAIAALLARWPVGSLGE